MKRKDFSHLKIEVQNEKNSSFEHENFIAGVAPNLRGPYSTMYVRRPWTIRQSINYSTAEESNAFYRRNFTADEKELSVVFDLPTHKASNSNQERVKGTIVKTKVSINSVEDVKILLDQIPLDKTPIAITLNGAILPILAFYIVAGIEQGVDEKSLLGTIQNDISKEFMVRNTNIYPPTPSMKIIADIFEYTSNNMPKFNSISISGCPIQEANASPETELAYTLANGLEYLKTGIESGMKIDTFAPNLSFFWAIGMDHFCEIAKMRAARMLWAKLVKQFNPKNQKSLALRTHCETSGWNLSKQDPFNNITRTTIEAMAAAFGGTQSLHTNTLDEAIALPTDFSARIARNTQIYIQEETQITKTVDPWAGSSIIEKQTEQIANEAWKLIQEVEQYGGITKAIEKGIPKIRIEEAVAKKQVPINSKQDTIVEINKYAIEKEANLQTLEVKNVAVKDSEIEKLKNLKANRNSIEVNLALANLTECAKTNNGNLLSFAIIAAQKRATLGEISDALEKYLEDKKQL